MDVLVRELHKPARRNFPRRRTKATFLNDLWQADLVEMIPYAKANDGYKYLLTQIDVYSKFAHAEPLRSKSGAEVANAFDKMLMSGGGAPSLLHTDKGKEFFNKDFRALMKKNKIIHYHTHSEVKAGVVERFNRTLKTRMWKEFTRRGSYRWLDLLPKLLHDYNTSTHSTTRAKPIDVVRKKSSVFVRPLPKRRKPKLKKGDKVRFSKIKDIFDKGYLQNWSNEVLTVNEVANTNPVTYKLEDASGEKLKGGFYEEELQKTKVPDFFLVEKVIKTKKVGNKLRYYVKWRGYDSKFNSWVDDIEGLH